MIDWEELKSKGPLWNGLWFNKKWQQEAFAPKSEEPKSEKPEFPDFNEDRLRETMAISLFQYIQSKLNSSKELPEDVRDKAFSHALLLLKRASYDPDGLNGKYVRRMAYMIFILESSYLCWDLLLKERAALVKRKLEELYAQEDKEQLSAERPADDGDEEILITVTRKRRKEARDDHA